MGGVLEWGGSLVIIVEEEGCGEVVRLVGLGKAVQSGGLLRLKGWWGGELLLLK